MGRNVHKSNLTLLLLGAAAILLCIGTAVIGRRKVRNNQIADYKAYISEDFLQSDISFASDSSDTARVKLYRNEQYDQWEAYIPSDMQDDLRIYFTKFAGIRFGDDTVYHSGDAIPVWDSNTMMPATAINWDGSEQPLGAYILFLYAGGTNTLYLNTQDDALAAVNEDPSASARATYVMKGADAGLISSGTLAIRLSNERSQAYPQKPYQLTLSSASPLNGGKQQATWQLLPDYIEAAGQLRNKVAFDLADRLRIGGIDPADLVNVYENGDYLGMYLLASKPEDAGETAEVEKVLGDDLSTGVDGDDSRDTDGQTVAENSSDTAANDGVAGAGSDHRSEIDFDALWQKLDKDSFERVYLLNEFLVTDQSKFTVTGGGNGKTSADDKLAAGGLWDYILSCGFTSQGDYPAITRQTLWLADRESELLAAMSRDPSFMGDVRNLYLQELSPMLDEYLTNELPILTYQTVSSGILSQYHYVSASQPDTSVWNMKRWLVDRKKFLDDYMANPSAYVRLNFQTSAGDLSYYAKKGETLNLNPVADEGEGTRIYMDDPAVTEKITGWIDENGDSLDPNEVVTDKMQGRTYSPVMEAVVAE